MLVELSYLEELVQAARVLLDWVPTYSEGSSGYARIERLKEVLARVAPSSMATSVKADLEHFRKDTGGEIARTVARCKHCGEVQSAQQAPVKCSLTLRPYGGPY